MNEYDIIRRPIITEKTTLLKDNGNQYVFEVHRDANKIEIKDAVEKLFKVKVLSVSVSNMEGKKKRLGRFAGKRSDWKKAIVKLSPKDKILIFEGAGA
ncbi:MAG: 50S ribosomal protein L23 [Syntrophorhabdaceae bacterium]|jgi:large subunit ribosomal protein L23|nr:50S ribosomal protein L23 [Syntrophorhabdaceae bacterium]MDD5243020.1 50S ribosomal protein L23 [Syntrophorhabdaceae bacterium]